MATGDLGLPLEPVVSHVEEELRLTPDFATTLHQPMVVPHALVLLLKVLHATPKHALMVNQ